MFTLEFDQDVFARLPEGVLSLTDPKLNTLTLQQKSNPSCPSRVPAITTKLNNLFKITCRSGTGEHNFIPGELSDCAKTYSGLLTVQSVIEPGGTFMNLINGGLVLPTTPESTKFIMMGRLAGANAKLVFNDPTQVSCTLMKGSNTANLVDRQGTKADYSAVKLQYKPVCSSKSVNDLKTKLVEIYEQADSVTNLPKLVQIRTSVIIIY